MLFPWFYCEFTIVCHVLFFFVICFTFTFWAVQCLSMLYPALAMLYYTVLWFSYERLCVRDVLLLCVLSPWHSGGGVFHWYRPWEERVHVALFCPTRRYPWSQLKRRVLPSLVPVWLRIAPWEGALGVLQYGAAKQQGISHHKQGH